MIGAKGGTGKEIICRICEKSASEVSEIRAIIRNPNSMPKDSLPNDSRIKLMAGDVTDFESIKRVLHGSNIVYFAAAAYGHNNQYQVEQLGVHKTALACKEANVERFVLVSAMGVHPNMRWSCFRLILNNCSGGCFFKKGLMDMKFEGENLLRASG